MLDDVATDFGFYNRFLFSPFVKEILDSVGLDYLWNDPFMVNGTFDI